MPATLRKIVSIDEEKCNGCGLCVPSCAEGAIQLVNGKAKLVSDVYCDGLGACLGPCPTGAIQIIEREAEEFDQEAADRHVAVTRSGKEITGGCPGSMAKTLAPHGRSPEPAPLACGCPGSMAKPIERHHASGGCACSDAKDDNKPAVQSELMNWPVQLKLVPPGAPYLHGADLVLAADCSAFAMGDFHRRFLKNKPLIIACPKLDDTQEQSQKLAQIIRTASLSSITVVRMEVPCCGGLTSVAKEAIRLSGKEVPLKVAVIGTDGEVQ